jgi:ABC-type nitrate/sulfonate/bicarbonate transport system permease component
VATIARQKLPPPTEIWQTAVSLVTTSSRPTGRAGRHAGLAQQVAAGFAAGAGGLAIAIVAG